MQALRFFLGGSFFLALAPTAGVIGIVIVLALFFIDLNVARFATGSLKADFVLGFGLVVPSVTEWWNSKGNCPSSPSSLAKVWCSWHDFQFVLSLEPSIRLGSVQSIVTPSTTAT